LKLLLMGAASLFLVGACTTPAPPGAPPPDLSDFHNQRIAFEPCGPYATTATDKKLFADKRLECARVQVPMDYDDPDGARGEVALLRIPASGKKIGSLIVNPGGPGGSGMNFVAAMASANPLWTEGRLGQRFDIIGFDPRGVGASLPEVDCFTDAEDDRGTGFDGGLDLDNVADADKAREVLRRCAESAGGQDALTSVGTRENARDMDVLRAVLGDEKLTFLGYSYGTELGGVYAEAFPQNVRAMILDGAVAPGKTPAELNVAQAKAYQKGFNRLAEECAKAPDCPLGTDPDRWVERFQALTRPLLDRPAPAAGGGRSLSYDDAITGALAGMRAESLRPRVIKGLTELAAGRGDTLLALRDLMYGRQPDGGYNDLGDSFIAIRCMDWPRRTPAEQTEMLRQIRKAAPIVDDGRPMEQSHHACEAWPKPPSRTGHWLTGEADLPPTLTVSTTGDVATPYQAGVDLAKTLGGSLLTVEGEQHGVSLIGRNACINDVLLDYLVDLKTPPEGTRCVL
jgi:pimeloyl-ACP methyl ester carboxylesterase